MWIRVISLRAPTTRLFSLFALLLTVVGLWGAVRPARPVASPPVPGPVYRVDTTDRAMALTINVVWGTEYVPRLLADLKAAHAVATFMVGGAWASAHPALVREMAAAGMEIGNHGWAHRHGAALSLSQNVSEIVRTNQAVRAITGTAPSVFAPPYGEFNPTVLKAAASLGMPLVMWTIDTIDWRPSSDSALIAERVLARARPGALVLMHPTDRTVAALPAVLRGLQHQGFRLVTVSRLLTLGPPLPDGR